MKKKNLIFLILFMTSSVLFSQLPEWKFYRDRDGNEYFIDKNGKIWTPSKPIYDYKAVSLKGITFYLTHARELLASFYYPEGLTILKSILAMPLNNNLIRKAQIDAAKEIQKLKNRNGTRYEKLNEEASIILFRKNENIIIINDLMKYELFIKNKFKIIRKRLKNKYNYKYQGITIGVHNDSNAKKTKIKYKYLIALDSEKFSKKVESIDLLEMSWKAKLGYENFKKKKIINEGKRRIYLIEKKIKPFVKGYEGFFINGKYTHIVRIITSKNVFLKNSDDMKKLIVGLKLL